MHELASRLASIRSLGHEERDAKLEAIGKAYDTPSSQNNLRAVIDWQVRTARIEAEILAAAPDVIVVEELDHFAEFAAQLAAHGYECGHAGALDRYKPCTDPGEHAVAYLEKRCAAGVAFAPKRPSTSRYFREQSGAKDADDDGVAIFWRKDMFILEVLEFFVQTTAGKNGSLTFKGAVKARLRRRGETSATNPACSGAASHLDVIGYHLSSGDEPKDERHRVVDEVQGSAMTLIGIPGANPHECASLKEWFNASMECGPTVLALDANATPAFNFAGGAGSSAEGMGAEPPTVWSELRGMPDVQSVWDAWYDPSGRYCGSPSQCAPVSTNKLRGPLSDQRRKIGLHALYLIDHIYFGKRWLNLVGHVREPLLYASPEEATASLLPSLAMPSDHCPVIVDLNLLPRAEREPS